MERDRDIKFVYPLSDPRELEHLVSKGNLKILRNLESRASAKSRMVTDRVCQVNHDTGNGDTCASYGVGIDGYFRCWGKVKYDAGREEVFDNAIKKLEDKAKKIPNANLLLVFTKQRKYANRIDLCATAIACNYVKKSCHF